ncbi:MAG: hypothetical protein SWX82_10180 [Cyanobacteriota bacterium]|nr:hypothetical protein [Cyanobacteriota bacterium]
MALLHESCVLNIHSAVISLSLAMITIYLLDNSYCSGDERHSE